MFERCWYVCRHLAMIHAHAEEQSVCREVAIVSKMLPSLSYILLVILILHLSVSESVCDVKAGGHAWGGHLTQAKSFDRWTCTVH